MLFLSMVRLIEYQEVDVTHAEKRVQKALMQNVRGTHDDHIFPEVLIPYIVIPKVYHHTAKQRYDGLIEVVLQDSKLLENKCHTIDLRDLSVGVL